MLKPLSNDNCVMNKFVIANPFAYPFEWMSTFKMSGKMWSENLICMGNPMQCMTWNNKMKTWIRK